MTLLKLLSPADYFTIANGVIGAIGIMYFIDGGDTHILIGTALILLGILMDGLDGAIARKFGSKHNLGIYLDSMSDSISFCFAPAVFIYKIFYDMDRGSALGDIDNFLAVAATVSIATFGIVRLAIFSYFKEDRLETFVGLPTPSMALFVLIAGILFQDFGRVLLPIFIGVGGLMLLNFPYPKIRGRIIAISLIAIGSGLTGCIMGIWEIDGYRFPLSISLALSVLDIASPIFTRKISVESEKLLQEAEGGIEEGEEKVTENEKESFKEKNERPRERTSSHNKNRDP